MYSRCFHRTYVILFDPWTISIWLFLALTAPSECMWSCLIPHNVDLTLPCSRCFPRTYVILFDPCLVPHNVDLTLPYSRCFHRTYVIFFNPYLVPHNVDLTLPCSCCFYRTYVILFDPWTTSIWPLPCSRHSRSAVDVILLNSITQLDLQIDIAWQFNTVLHLKSIFEFSFFKTSMQKYVSRGFQGKRTESRKKLIDDDDEGGC